MLCPNWGFRRSQRLWRQQADGSRDEPDVRFWKANIHVAQIGTQAHLDVQHR